MSSRDDRPVDLDEAIGDLRREAARRRAEPGFPLDEEAHLSAELDEQAPGPGGDRLHAIAREMRSVARSATGSPGRGRLRGAGARGSDRMAALADLIANAVLTVSTRLGDAERRLAVLERDSADRTPGARAVPFEHETWLERIIGAMTTGRTLYYASQPEEAVGTLRRRGIDAYGVAPPGSAVQRHPDVRQEDLETHLESVGSGALTAVVLVGLTWQGGGSGLDHVASQVRRVAGAAFVISEAPWSWRERVGDEAADRADGRPLSPESWLAALDRAGFSATAEYDGTGRGYLVTAGRRS